MKDLREVAKRCNRVLFPLLDGQSFRARYVSSQICSKVLWIVEFVNVERTRPSF